ncbi:MAG: D-2-hydroxyacid dehydrogenase [Dehalococcoidia bacterium]|nr:D-2-hydroxyacid dehydrogenase [Dehalococcoidia bacterium]MSQ34860.1 D-2-hydroxyacid dehydrogenase [Dehalococcoidia bacterium]
MPALKVVIASTHLGERFINDLRADFPGVAFAPAYSPADAAREARDADVFFGWPDKRTFETARKLQWIACPGAGVDRIVAIEEIVNSTVLLTNAPGPHVAPMADYTLGVMLALAHRLPQSVKEQEKREWNTARYERKIVELAGKTIGLYGLGAIGRAIAKRAAGFDMTLYAVDPHPAEVPANVKACWPMSGLDQMCQIADWIIITAPLTVETRRSMDRRRLALMKRDAYVIVVSRGGVVDQPALVDALKEGRLAGAALDATEPEPLDAASPLWDMPNVIITPHVSALSPEMYEGRRRIFRENVRRFIVGDELLHLCDKRAGF